jgi:hypothetical protein
MDSINDFVDMHGILSFDERVLTYLQEKYKYIKSYYQKAKTIKYHKELIDLNTLKYVKHVLYLLELEDVDIISKSGQDLDTLLESLKKDTDTFLFSYGDGLDEVCTTQVEKWCELMLEIPEDKEFGEYYSIKLTSGNSLKCEEFDNGSFETKCPVYNISRIGDDKEELCFKLKLGYRKTKYDFDDTEIIKNAYAVFNDGSLDHELFTFNYVKYVE